MKILLEIDYSLRKPIKEGTYWINFIDASSNQPKMRRHYFDYEKQEFQFKQGRKGSVVVSWFHQIEADSQTSSRLLKSYQEND